MSKSDDFISISKYLSYLLRHHPEDIGLELDKNGWAEVAGLIKKAKGRGRPISRRDIKHVIANGSKQRFILSDDEEYIRAGYGHSINVDLELEPSTPPDELYHGTARKNLSSIIADGIHPGSRNFVHLSITTDDAQFVGRRHGKPAILKVNAKQMSRNGYEFYQSASEPCIWLTKNVPSDFLELE